MKCDLSKFDSVRSAAAKLTELTTPLGGIDVLANNAGIMLFDDIATPDGYDIQMQARQPQGVYS